jgi:hypothetical protein
LDIILRQFPLRFFEAQSARLSPFDDEERKLEKITLPSARSPLPKRPAAIPAKAT